jgi:hypothetical protein
MTPILSTLTHLTGCSVLVAQYWMCRKESR